uniref:Uncharacterized protein n=1 Tax=Caenorhabditis japonica TaxID=281687 RepID=A0A8R1I6W6_CAEJA
MQYENNRPPIWSESHSKENLRKQTRKTESKITLNSRLSSSDLVASRVETSKEDDGETPRPTSNELNEVNRIRAEARARDEEEEEKEKLTEVKKEEDADGSVIDNASVISRAESNISFSEMPSDSVPQEDRASLPSTEKHEIDDVIDEPIKKQERKDSSSSLSSLEDRSPATSSSVNSSSLKGRTKERGQRWKNEDIRGNNKTKTKICSIM